MRPDYRVWLETQKYDAATVTAQMHRVGRVEKQYGDLLQHYLADQLRSLIGELRYTTEDERQSRPNPSKISIDGDIRNNLSSYRNAVERYCRFLSGSPILQAENIDFSILHSSNIPALEEDLGQRFGLERDMQTALRREITQLEAGLVIIDDGAERSVESGFIDITARDVSGAIVVIELKAGAAGQKAIAQILSYMGDIAAEEPNLIVRGMLIASGFDQKAKSAARMAPALELHSYGVRFQFSRESL